MRRTWIQASGQSLLLWDLGDTYWMLKDDQLRYFQVVTRSVEGSQMIEEVEELPEVPVSVEAVLKEVEGWSIQDEVLAKVPKQQLTSSVNKKSNSQNKPTSQSSARHLQPQRSRAVQGDHQQLHLQKQDIDQVSHITDSSQSCEPPQFSSKHLWSSLSQWIPQSALFQPSLHHQAQQELTGMHIQVVLSSRGGYQGRQYSRGGQGQHRPFSQDQRIHTRR